MPGRYLTLSWDDGFRRSCEVIAALYERFGFRAEFNLVATRALSGGPSAVHADFGFWNELQARGHSIQPHGFDHSNKSILTFEEGKDRILRCLDVFSRSLAGFSPERAIFAFPYNTATPALEAWLAGVVRAYRLSAGGPAVMPLPTPATRRIHTVGIEAAAQGLENALGELKASANGWLVYTAHGLDGEGWGPMRREFLEEFLERMAKGEDGVRLISARDLLDQTPGAS
ncbi:MAG: polysaccharide deacetylase family protein [Spirochaetes bacterium]|nr:polysaccharide deacetylase family protein [Spirochaetota bacterium]